jgi:ABC-type glycerol-3-phosphate transport system substrate-binding protein
VTAQLTRRAFLRSASLATCGGLLAACQPKIVEVTREVEKVVKETVEVEKEVEKVVEKEVEKVVKETVVVDRQAELAEKLKGKISWETWRGPGTGWNEERMQSFSEMYPGVEFEFRPMPYGDYAKMYTEAAAGDLGDIISFDPGHMVFEAAIENGLLLAWDDLIAADPSLDLTEWFDVFINMQYYQGKLYGLPSWGWGGHDTLIANKVHMEEAGIDVPAPDARDISMEEIADFIRKVHVKGSIPGEVERWGANIMIGEAAFGPILRAYGGNVLNEDGTKLVLDSEESIQGLKWIYQLAVEEQVLGWPGDVAGNRATAWGEGIGCTMYGGGALDVVRTLRPAIKDPAICEPTTIYYPKRADGRCPSWVMGGTWNINAKTEYPEICYEFIKHLTTNEGSLQFNLIAGEGALVRKDTYELLKIRDEAYAWGEESLFNGMQYQLPANLRGTEMRNALTQQWTLMMDRRQPMPFEQGLEELITAVQNVLDMPPA